MRRLFGVAVNALLLFVTAASGSAASPSDDLERRVMAFSRQMRCLVCQNETLADSQADFAVDLRREIRVQMEAGRSDLEITTYLTDRYGDFIRYRPAVKPATYALWFGPFVLLAGGLAALSRTLISAPASAALQPSTAARKRVRQLLEGTTTTARDPNVELYRSQLAELQADRNAEILTDEQFGVERDELERRLLSDLGLHQQIARR